MTKTKARRYRPKKGKTTHRRLDSEEANKAYTRLNKPDKRRDSIRSQGRGGNKKLDKDFVSHMLTICRDDPLENERRLSVIYQAMKNETNPHINMHVDAESNQLIFTYYNQNGAKIEARWTGNGSVFEDDFLQLYNFLRGKGSLTHNRSTSTKCGSILSNIRKVCIRRP